MMAASLENRPFQKQSEPVYVAKESDFLSKTNHVVTVQGREIVIFRHRGKYYALDRQCYHAGGPLQLGDIEDIQGHPCVICPWHRYIICMDSGEGLYQAIDPSNRQKAPTWKSKGLKQRTHEVWADDGQVYLRLSDLSTELPSDHYHSEEYRRLVWKVPQTKNCSST